MTSIDVETWYGVTLTGAGTNKHIAEVDFTANNLQGTLPYAVRYLPYLTECSLARNDLTSLGSGITLLTGLRVLDASDNQLTSLPSTIGDLVNLQELHVDDNRISTLPTSIGNLRALDICTMENNVLTALPATIS